MRHRKAGVKLNRTSSHRNAMFRNMVTSLLKHDRIKTTDVKAKELRRWADHVITLAKRGDLHARRQALSIVREKDVVHKLFEQAESRFGHINGGYTRIVKIGTRPGDAAPVSLIELVSAEQKPKKKKKTKTAEKEITAQPSVKAQQAKPEPAETSEAPKGEEQVEQPEKDTQQTADEQTEKQGSQHGTEKTGFSAQAETVDTQVAGETPSEDEPVSADAEDDTSTEEPKEPK
jgi:large subunit ribosomal protein L17